MKIGCDIDGVLADIYPALVKAAKMDFDIDIGEYQTDEPFEQMVKLYDIQPEWVNKTFNSEWFWSWAKPIINNIEMISHWKELGNEIHLITGRGPTARMPTYAWLSNYYVQYDELSFTPVMSKHEYLIENDINIMFEDRFFEAQRISVEGIHSFVVRRPYNIHYEERVTNPKYLHFVDDLKGAEEWIPDLAKMNLKN